MKRLVGSFLVCVCLLPHFSRGDNSAQFNAQRLSVSFQQGSDLTGAYKLRFSSSDQSIDGELAYFSDSRYTSYLTLDYVLAWAPFSGLIGLDIPQTDANQNGLNDFFEVACAVSADTTGAYEFQDGPYFGNVEAIWTRSAGSKSGTCTMKFLDFNTSQYLGIFTMNFTIRDYEGRLDYTSNFADVLASFSATQNDEPEARLYSTWHFTRSFTNSAGSLVLNAGTWTNQAGQVSSFEQTPITRYRTNHTANLTFSDGEVWAVTIRDSNDSNRNGTPDLSDLALAAPKLSICHNNGQVQLGIHGPAGRTYELQGPVPHRPKAPNALMPTNDIPVYEWLTVKIITLTNAVEYIDLPASGTNQIWHLRTDPY